MPPNNPIPTPPQPERISQRPEIEVSNTTPELQPSLGEAQPIMPSGVPADPLPSAPPAQTPVAQGTTPSSATTAPINLPAADAELIEKHWVDQAEHIIDTDQDDPQKEEAEEEHLSDQYLKQRFGHDVNQGE